MAHQSCSISLGKSERSSAATIGVAMLVGLPKVFTSTIVTRRARVAGSSDRRTWSCYARFPSKSFRCREAITKVLGASLSVIARRHEPASIAILFPS